MPLFLDHCASEEFEAGILRTQLLVRNKREGGFDLFGNGSAGGRRARGSDRDSQPLRDSRCVLVRFRDQHDIERRVRIYSVADSSGERFGKPQVGFGFANHKQTAEDLSGDEADIFPKCASNLAHCRLGHIGVGSILYSGNHLLSHSGFAGEVLLRKPLFDPGRVNVIGNSELLFLATEILREFIITKLFLQIFSMRPHDLSLANPFDIYKLA